MNNNHGFTPTQRKGPLWSGLRNRGCNVDEIIMDSGPVISITTPAGKKWLTSTNVSYPFASKLAYEIANNKQAVYRLASEYSITVPRSMIYRSEGDLEAVLAFLRNKKHLVVKPNDSFGSQGVTVGVTESEGLKYALEKAQKIDSLGVALVEEFIAAGEYRFTVLDNQVISVLQRRSASVHGDGSSSVSELIALENEARSKDNEGRSFIQYPMLEGNLIKDVDQQYIPAKDELVTLNKSSMVSGGASIVEVIDYISDTYKQLAVKIADILGARFAAVDIFIFDAKSPLRTDSYCLNEVNFSPALKLYYAARNKDISNVPNRIIDRLIQSIDEI